MIAQKKTNCEEFVLDSSIALAWCFPDEHAPYPQAVLDSLASMQAVVPPLWLYEVSNGLLVSERRKRSTQADTVNWLKFLYLLPIKTDDTTSPTGNDLVILARTNDLSTYDAAYLELALRRGLALATLDGKLKIVSSMLGVAEHLK